MLERVVVLVDWDCAQRVVPSQFRKESRRLIEAAIESLQGSVASFLQARDSQNHYQVEWRIYHGWHRGKTATQIRRDFEQFVAVARGRRIDNVVFRADFHFGNNLLCETRRNPIFDTLRTLEGVDRQKMVDASLVCDLLHLVRFEKTIVVIIADDDDFVPAAITAEAWRGRVALLRRRTSDNKHLNTDGIVFRL